MERYVIVIPADAEDGGAYLKKCDDGDTCRLETLQELVGGPIEVAESALAGYWAREPVDSIKLVVNEEGKLRELPLNGKATTLSAYDFLCGTAVLLAARGEELIGFTEPVAESIRDEWELWLSSRDDKGEASRCQTFNPD